MRTRVRQRTRRKHAHRYQKTSQYHFVVASDRSNPESQCYHSRMPVGSWGGYVLAGGQSTRMGTDKAMLVKEGRPLLLRAAEILEKTGAAVAIVGHPDRYTGLGYRVIPDCFPKAGPLGGIHAALNDSECDWNFVLACDMPRVNLETLLRLHEAALQTEAAAVIPVSDDGYAQPLCAAYHRKAKLEIERALQSGEGKILRALARKSALLIPWEDGSVFQNCNTPDEWQALGTS